MRAQRYIPIDSIDDFITNIDLGNAPENVAIEMRGFRTSKGQMVGVRDFDSNILRRVTEVDVGDEVVD